MSNRDLVEQFYRAFQQKDWKTMQSCYHDDVVFSDPVFPNLRGQEAKAMWHMLASSAKDLTITYSNCQAYEHQGSCNWEATYSFSRTGARVHNIIQARFEFRDGKIIAHTDEFNLTRWAGMALGLPGKLFGWTSWMKQRIRDTAASGLSKFLAANPQYGITGSRPK